MKLGVMVILMPTLTFWFGFSFTIRGNIIYYIYEICTTPGPIQLIRVNYISILIQHKPC